MSQYTAQIRWQRQGQNFLDNEYSRGHIWAFDGGAEVQASASPQVVPLPMSVAENVDPEEAFVAAVSSCHMLFFLAIAAKRRLLVDSYIDNALGVMEPNSEGRIAMTTITLRPEVIFGGENQPSRETLEAMHHRAHELCFIANSVKTKIITEIPD